MAAPLAKLLMPLAALLAGGSGVSDEVPLAEAVTARASAAPAYGDYDATGMASWYGAELAGRRTASGEPFDPDALTGAHPHLPMGTLLEVTDVDTGQSVVVRVNDRGPFTRKRIVDISRGAARQLGIDRKGVARVRVRELEGGEGAGGAALSSPDHPGYVVQVASFSSAERAETLAEALGGSVVTTGTGFWRVMLGPFADGKAAGEGLNLARQNGYDDARIQRAGDR